MKPKKTLTALTALWVLLVLLEGTSSMIRRWYSRKMGAVARAVSGAVSFGKLAAMVVLALSNVLLFLKHVGDDDNRSRMGDDRRVDVGEW
jgi:hypothetical protein